MLFTGHCCHITSGSTVDKLHGIQKSQRKYLLVGWKSRGEGQGGRYLLLTLPAHFQYRCELLFSIRPETAGQGRETSTPPVAFLRRVWVKKRLKRISEAPSYG
ncbi:uncharacterized protein LOC127750057 [Frankliniella occidentalis]|uniref:Uncharacterized protein LOC127750057 n=1 Tax=Frankliniella occidentalis TaxID=133901 RepID=A0A9C6X0S7_FRAOC|nr:uncharacterized protein LOC127750057 [Frankliniella occidentalis]